MAIIRTRSLRAEIRRKAHRRSLKLPARIDVGRQRVLYCIVDEFTEDGARLVLSAGAWLPITFSLLLSENGKLLRKCRLIWHDELEFGVEFYDESVKVPGLSISDG